jgi:N-acetylglucosaminyl-diphospho-decaprenol L-rhamnosyltransferase
MSLGICVVAFNTDPQLLESCLESIRAAAKYARLEVATVIVDNSGNESLRRLFEQDVDIWHESPGNVGFGVACNLGIRLLKSNADCSHVLFLNPDAKLEPDAISAFLTASTESNSRLLAGWLETNEGIQTDAFMHWWFSAERVLRRRRYRAHLEAHSRESLVEVQKVSGGALWGRMDELLALGPFDERFFLYGEDADLSLRARAIGISLYAVPRARISHIGASSSHNHSKLVERARIDATIRLATYRKGLLFSYLVRVDLLIATILGLLPGLGASSSSKVGRAARLTELRRWGWHRSVERFAPGLI